MTFNFNLQLINEAFIEQFYTSPENSSLPTDDAKRAKLIAVLAEKSGNAISLPEVCSTADGLEINFQDAAAFDFLNAIRTKVANNLGLLLNDNSVFFPHTAAAGLTELFPTQAPAKAFNLNLMLSDLRISSIYDSNRLSRTIGSKLQELAKIEGIADAVDPFVTYSQEGLKLKIAHVTQRQRLIAALRNYHIDYNLSTVDEIVLPHNVLFHFFTLLYGNYAYTCLMDIFRKTIPQASDIFEIYRQNQLAGSLQAIIARLQRILQQPELKLDLQAAGEGIKFDFALREVAEAFENFLNKFSFSYTKTNDCHFILPHKQSYNFFCLLLGESAEVAVDVLYQPLGRIEVAVVFDSYWYKQTPPGTIPSAWQVFSTESAIQSGASRILGDKLRCITTDAPFIELSETGLHLVCRHVEQLKNLERFLQFYDFTYSKPSSLPEKAKQLGFIEGLCLDLKDLRNFMILAFAAEYTRYLDLLCRAANNNHIIHYASHALFIQATLLAEKNNVSDGSENYATWPPKRELRYYSGINPGLRGYQLPSFMAMRAFNANHNTAELQSVTRERIKTTRIYSQLPRSFMAQFLETQSSDAALRFPNIAEDKSNPVRNYLLTDPKFAEENWAALGFTTRADYRNWLDQPMLTAFSSSAHYCVAKRVFEYVGNNALGEEVFKPVKTNENKIVQILSVSGFEYRGYKADINLTYDAVEKASKQTMDVILKAAIDQNASNVVLIPVGMGVFLPGNRDQAEQVTQRMLKGWKASVQEYQGTKLTFHCCLSGLMFETISADLPTGSPLNFVHHANKDAYTIACSLEDQGQRTLLINAADDDWKVLLKGGKDDSNLVHPGQYGAGHGLYDRTSDEYYFLMTDFALCSLKNLRIHHSLADSIKTLPAGYSRAQSMVDIRFFTDNSVTEEGSAAPSSPAPL